MRIVFLVLVTALSTAGAQTTFTVTTINDSGPGSLRQAILDANASPTADAIAFSIPGGGPHTIQPLSALPRIEAPITLDGLTQPGADCSTWPATLLIELDGSATSAVGLDVFTSDTVIRGLVINRFHQEGIRISGFVNGGPDIEADDNVIECVYIGTDVTGTVDLGNDDDGVLVQRANRTRIGGPGPGQRNLISGNVDEGIRLSSGTDGAVIQGNYIGTDVTGTAALPNDQSGITIVSGSNSTPPSTNHQIGGTDHDPGVCNRVCNLISGNDEEGIDLFGPADNPSTGTVIEGNFIGTTVTGTAPLGNGDEGVSIFNGSNNRVGGTAPGAGNLISANGEVGLDVTGEGSVGNAVLSNRFAGNVGLGIVIGGIGTTNDVGDGDEGANRLQNHPDLAAATLDISGSLSITYTVDTARTNAAYPLTVEFFQADADAEEGQTLLGRHTYRIADAQQPAMTTITASGAEEGDRIVATATDADGNSSPFSPSVEVAVGTTAAGAPSRGGVRAWVIANPSPEPILRVGVDHPQLLRVTLHDVRGRALAVVHQGSLPPGVHSIPLGASGLARGVYVVRVVTSTGTVTAYATVIR